MPSKLNTSHRLKRLGYLGRQISNYNLHETKVPLRIIDEYIALASHSHQTAFQASNSLFYQTQQLIQEERFLEALQKAETGLKLFGYLSTSVHHFESVTADVLEALLTLVNFKPEHLEIGPSYEKLVDLGHVNLPLHVGAVFHYILCNKIGRATALAEKLSLVAPNYPGLKDLMEQLELLNRNDPKEQSE